MVDYREFCGRLKRKIAVNIAISIGTGKGRKGEGAHDKLESLDGNTNLRFRPATFSQPYFRNFLALVWRVASITIVIVPRNCAGLPLERDRGGILALVLINRVQHELGWSIPPTCFLLPIRKYLGEIQRGKGEEDSDKREFRFSIFLC